MAKFTVSMVKITEFGKVDSALRDIGLGKADIKAYLKDSFFWTGSEAPQAKLAELLEKKLVLYFQSEGLQSTRDQSSEFVRCSSKVSYKADVVAFRFNQAKKRVFCEVEMRPNFEKDMVKFQIAHENNLLQLAVLIVIIKRNEINPNYTTMPEYELVSKKIEEYNPIFPMLLIGIGK